MALTDTFIKNAKHSGKPAGDKYSDGGGMFLHVKAAGKYWRMAYRMHDKQKTLYIGVYPAVSLAQARKARDTAKEQLAQGIDPSIAKQEDKKRTSTPLKWPPPTPMRLWRVSSTSSRLLAGAKATHTNGCA